MKIFLGLTEVAGYYTNLKKGFDELGIQNTYVNLIDPYKHHAGESSGLSERFLRYTSEGRCCPKRYANLIWRAWFRCLYRVAVLWIILTHDVFIFGFASTFLEYRELALLKLLRKKIIFVFHGSDSRPPYLNGKFEQIPSSELLQEAVMRKRRLEIIERYSDVTVDCPTTAHFHEKPFINVLILGVPFDGRKIPTGNGIGALPGNAVRIVHAPTDPERKGTAQIRTAIEELRSEGYTIEYVECIGLPNSAVLSHLANCDFVVDQLYSDAVMTGLSTEAAYFGKPTVFGGYGYTFLAKKMTFGLPPIHHSEEGYLKEAIKKLISDGAYRKELGQQAQQFVQQYCSPKAVALRYLKVLEGDIPEDWWCNPMETEYVHGYGLTESRAKTLIRRLIDEAGIDALQLSDKPELKERIVRFART